MAIDVGEDQERSMGLLGAIQFVFATFRRQLGPPRWQNKAFIPIRMAELRSSRSADDEATAAWEGWVIISVRDSGLIPVFGCTLVLSPPSFMLYRPRLLWGSGLCVYR